MPGRDEIAVVGAGIVGLATAYALSERGLRATVYEAGVPGERPVGRRVAHLPPLARRPATGASGDRGAGRLARVERATRAPSWSPTTAWSRLGEPARPTAGRARGGGRRAGPGINAAELAERLPLLGTYAGPATLDEAGGAIRTEVAIGALTAALHDGLVADEVIAVRPTSGGRADVIVGDGRREYARVVVCAGRGTAALAAGLGLALPVSTTVHTRVTFAVRGDPPARLACLQDGSGAFGRLGAYGTPHPGNRLYSVGLTEGAPVSEDAAAYVGRALPGLDPRPAGVRNCWVTRLPWGPDGIAVWEADGILLLVGNNLFKHAPRLGRALAAAAVGEDLMPDLRPEARLGRAPTP